jgi:ankyrin repeat protein
VRWWRLCACCGESVSQDGETALICAAIFGRIDCVRLLVEIGADKDVKNNVHFMFSFLCCAYLIYWDLHKYVSLHSSERFTQYANQRLALDFMSAHSYMQTH